MLNDESRTANQLVDARIFDDRNEVITAVFHFMEPAWNDPTQINFSTDQIMNGLLLTGFLVTYLRSRGA